MIAHAASGRVRRHDRISGGRATLWAVSTLLAAGRSGSNPYRADEPTVDFQIPPSLDGLDLDALTVSGLSLGGRRRGRRADHQAQGA